jgi:hypothetical protein
MSQEVVGCSSENPIALGEDPGVSPEDSIVLSKVVGIKRELLRSCLEDPSAFREVADGHFTDVSGGRSRFFTRRGCGDRFRQ